MEAITLPDTTAIEASSHSLLEVAKALVVSNSEQEQRAAGMIVSAKRYIKEAVDAFTPAKSAANTAHKEICALENGLSNPFKQVIAVLQPKLLDYQQEQERQRQAKEAELREAARRQEEERRLQQAMEAERQGKTAAVEELLAMPIEAPPVIVPKAPTPANVTRLEKWTYRIDDETLIPRKYLIVDARALAATARTQKSKASVPGVKFFDEGTLRVNTKKG